MRRASPLLLVTLAAGCGMDLGAPNDWVAADTVPPPLELDAAFGTGAPAIPGQQLDTIRVVTFNVMMCADPAALATAIRNNPAIHDAGVFLLQEAEAYPEEGTSRARRLAEALGLGFVYVPGRTKGTGTHGLAIMSRFPISEVEMMDLPRTQTGHQRIAVMANILIGDRVLPVIDVHLETTINIRDRILQLRPAVLELPAPALVAGDMNTNPYLWEEGTVPVLPPASAVDTDQAPILDDYMRGIGFATPAADVGVTERKYGIESRLDAIYTRGLQVTPATVERTVEGSDHWPVWVDVTIP